MLILSRSIVLPHDVVLHLNRFRCWIFLTRTGCRILYKSRRIKRFESGFLLPLLFFLFSYLLLFFLSSLFICRSRFIYLLGIHSDSSSAFSYTVDLLWQFQIELTWSTWIESTTFRWSGLKMLKCSSRDDLAAYIIRLLIFIRIYYSIRHRRLFLSFFLPFFLPFAPLSTSVSSSSSSSFFNVLVPIFFQILFCFVPGLFCHVSRIRFFLSPDIDYSLQFMAS